MDHKKSGIPKPMGTKPKFASTFDKKLEQANITLRRSTSFSDLRTGVPSLKIKAAGPLGSKSSTQLATTSMKTIKQETRGPIARKLTRRSKSYSDLSKLKPLKPLVEQKDLRKLHPLKPVVEQKVSGFPSNVCKRGVKRVVEETKTSHMKVKVLRPEIKKPEKEKPKLPSKYDYKGKYNLLLERYKEMKNKYLEEKEMWLEKEKTQINLTEKLSTVEMELDDLKKKYKVQADILETLNAEIRKLTADNLDATNLNRKQEAIIETYIIEAQKHEELRRHLHNVVQDLKGNIRVLCRIRPPLCSESDRTICNINYLDECAFEIRQAKQTICSVSGDTTELKLQFNFDRVFPPQSTQEEVFEELAQLVQSSLDGYHVCVFAYGQTGSGKTFTMQGNNSEKELGMIPRAMKLLFEKIKAMEYSKWRYNIKVSFLEIYNENIHDLLEPTVKKHHDICYNDGKGVSVTNVKVESINSAEDFLNLMMAAQMNRAVASNNFNEHSSRSHAITKISVEGYNEVSNAIYIGSLNLVDLAGSESAKNSSSERITETKNINRSLSALGVVMMALHNKDSHVPYRNSKLTYMLQSCLGGNSKTLMFVNISPIEECCNESINSLRFAAKVKEVRTSTRRNKIYANK